MEENMNQDWENEKTQKKDHRFAFGVLAGVIAAAVVGAGIWGVGRVIHFLPGQSSYTTGQVSEADV